MNDSLDGPLYKTPLPGRQRALWIGNAAAAVLIGLGLMYFSAEIVEALSRFLNRIHRPLVSFRFGMPEALLFALIPLGSCFLYRNQPLVSAKHILKANAITLLSILVTSVVAFCIISQCVKSGSVCIPDYIVITPFPFFWPLVFITGLAGPHLANILLKKTKPKG